jgi:hypothetical protein
MDQRNGKMEIIRFRHIVKRRIEYPTRNTFPIQIREKLKECKIKEESYC